MTGSRLGPWFGAGALALGVGLHARGLLGLRRLEARSGASWWVGYARDAVNLGGALLLLAGLWCAGYPGPQGLALALAATLVSYGLDAAAARGATTAKPRWWVTMTAAALAVAGLAAARPLVADRLGRLLAALAPPAP